MRIAAALSVVCLFVVMGCEKSGGRDTAAPQDAASVGEVSAEASEAESDATLVIIPGQGVGKLQFGMNQAELEAILGKPERTTYGPSEYMSKGMAVMEGRDTAVGALLFGDANNPTSPLVEACKFRTDKGIGMGSTFADLEAAYGKPSSVKENAGRETLKYSDLGATFSLSGGKVFHMMFRKPRR